MEHASDLTGLAVVILTALGCGMAMARFRQPALVGYLFAGVPGATTPVVLEADGRSVAAWAGQQLVYVLMTGGGTDALRRIL